MACINYIDYTLNRMYLSLVFLLEENQKKKKTMRDQDYNNTERIMKFMHNTLNYSSILI